MKPAITVVLSTYNRPDTLQTAINTVLFQSFPNWRLLVIGDRCDGRTSEVVCTFRDPRISYVNLAVRCGEQSGPNSVGIALADTPYLAFLNHDDILIGDHFEHGVGQLQKADADFFVGRTAFANESRECANGSVKPLFCGVSETEPDPADSMRSMRTARAYSFEPSSSWMVRTATAKEAGFWRRRDQVFGITPLQEWVRRAWRNRAKFVFGQKITVLKLTTHDQPRYQNKSGDYGRRSLEHCHVMEKFHRQDCDDMRRIILQEVEANQLAAAAPPTSLAQRVVSHWRRDSLEAMVRYSFRWIIVKGWLRLDTFLAPKAKTLFLEHDIDILRYPNIFIAWFHGQKRKRIVEDTVFKRTGEHLGRQYEIEEIVLLTLKSLEAPREDETRGALRKNVCGIGHGPSVP